LGGIPVGMRLLAMRLFGLTLIMTRSNHMSPYYHWNAMRVVWGTIPALDKAL
jgi:hypothetical protein